MPELPNGPGLVSTPTLPTVGVPRSRGCSHGCSGGCTVPQQHCACPLPTARTPPARGSGQSGAVARCRQGSQDEAAAGRWGTRWVRHSRQPCGSARGGVSSGSPTGTARVWHLARHGVPPRAQVGPALPAAPCSSRHCSRWDGWVKLREGTGERSPASPRVPRNRGASCGTKRGAALTWGKPWSAARSAAPPAQELGAAKVTAANSGRVGAGGPAAVTARASHERRNPRALLPGAPRRRAASGAGGTPQPPSRSRGRARWGAAAGTHTIHMPVMVKAGSMTGRIAQAGMAGPGTPRGPGPSGGVSCCRVADGPRSPWAAPAEGPGPGAAGAGREERGRQRRSAPGRDGPGRLRPAGSHSAAEPAPPGGQRGAALARPDPGRHVAAAPPARGAAGRGGGRRARSGRARSPPRRSDALCSPPRTAGAAPALLGLRGAARSSWAGRTSLTSLLFPVHRQTRERGSRRPGC